LAPDPTQSSLFTRAEPSPDENDPGDDLLTGIGCTLLFGAALVFALVGWDSVALDPDSFASGRTASIRRLLGRIGQVPVVVVLALITLFSLYVAITSIRTWRQARNE
jgi:hypothetical protein